MSKIAARDYKGPERYMLCMLCKQQQPDPPEQNPQFYRPSCKCLGCAQIEAAEGARPFFKAKTRNQHHKTPQNRAKTDFE